MVSLFTLFGRFRLSRPSIKQCVCCK